jgi:DNA-binding NarL/FixJ family response regulator
MALCKLLPRLPIIVVSAHDSIDSIEKAFACGIRGFIPKSSHSGTMLGAINTVFSGEIFLPEHAIHLLLPEPESPPLPCSLDDLTERQREILQLLAEGMSNKAIANKLQLAEVTVKAHVSALFQRLGVVNRTQAGMMAARLERERTEVAPSP